MNGIIIQARMTSKRFPGKSMALLAGKPVLQHVIERCKEVPLINRVVVAMPEMPESKPMADLCMSLNVPCYAGSEDDVLLRYYVTACAYGLTTIMRITADCPLIKLHTMCETLWRHKSDAEYTSNGINCEVFSFACLKRAHRFATDPYDREHVTPWMKREAALSVDYPEDIAKLEAILAAS